MTISLTRRTLIATAAAAGLVRFAPAQDRRRLVIVTGGTGGVFYPYGGGLAKVLSENVANLQATAQVTGGSVDNVKLLAAGEADIGFSTIDSAYDGITGTGAYAEDGSQDVRVIARLYDSFLHVVASASAGITSVADLKGKRVSVGSAGSSTESIADRVLAAAGLDPMNDVSRDNLSVAESAGALKDGKVDAFFWIGGIPTSAVQDLASSGQPAITFVPTGTEAVVLQTRYPNLYLPMSLPENAYAGQTAAVEGLGVANVLLVAGAADGGMVGDVLAGIFDHLDAVHAIHPEAAKLALDGAYARLAVPYHPAAEAFYAARGIAAR
jgi:TRAP transporter TAXI family solute receptor